MVRVEQAPVVPTTQELAEPMTGSGKKLTIPKTWMSENQLTKILQNTPAKYVYKKPARGGGKPFDFVTVSYIQKALNYIFGWNWDFEIVEHGIQGGQVWVHGKLTVRGSQPGQVIVKTQFGRADLKKKRDSGEFLDFGNDLKAASSDALKKCASMLGIASDIYGKAEYKDEAGKDPVEVPVVQMDAKESVAAAVHTAKMRGALKFGQIVGPDGEITYACKEDGDPISYQVAIYSMSVFGKFLCKEHQAEARPLKKK